MQLQIIPQLSTTSNSYQGISELPKPPSFDYNPIGYTEHCLVCGTDLPHIFHKGRPFKFCSPECRKTANSILRQKRNGTKWTIEERNAILERDGSRCVYCGCGTAGVDHVFPICKGGIHTKGNAVACCRSCNSKKGFKIDDRAIKHLIEKGEDVSWLEDIHFLVYRDDHTAYINGHTGRTAHVSLGRGK